MILSAGEGEALVVVDKDMYRDKCMTFLSDQTAYQGCKDLVILFTTRSLDIFMT